MYTQTQKTKLFTYTTLFRSIHLIQSEHLLVQVESLESLQMKISQQSKILKDLKLEWKKHYLRTQLQLQLEQFSEHLTRSEEHTSELQSRPHLVCRLLLEKKK